MDRADNNWLHFRKIKYFKKLSKISIMKVGLLTKYSSQKNNFERFDQFYTLKNDFQTQNFEIFDKVVHNFGKSDNVII